MTNDTAGSQLTLEDLLTFPYLWKPKKISDFLKASWNIIKDNDHPDFTTLLNSNSIHVIPSNENWVDIIGTLYWEILKLDGQGKIKHRPDSNQSKSVYELLRVIRNKYEHCREYPLHQKNILNWFNQNIEFDEGKFISFWMKKFPNLISFLWVEFNTFRGHSSLKEYYSTSMETFSDKLIMDSNIFTERLSVSLLSHLENGNLLNRFKCTEESHPCTLEFRSCTGLGNILNGASFVRVLISSEENKILAVYHHYQYNTPEQLDLAQFSSMTNKTYQLIFANEILDDVWKYCGMCEKIIIFGEKDKLCFDIMMSAIDKFKIQYPAANFPEFPVSWSELSKPKQEMMYDKGVVCVQGRYVDLKDIISENERDHVFGKLSGGVLNQLMKQQIPSLFCKYELSSVEKFYVPRRLCVNELNFVAETQLLEDIINKNQRLVLFVAEPGMGKSQLLVSLANSLNKSLVILCSMKDFVNKLSKEMKMEECTKNEVKAVIQQVLICDNDSEKEILNQFLDQHQKSPQVDLMLDGFDEVPPQYKKLAVNILELIINEMYNIRLWISSREPFSFNVGDDKLSCFCKLLPFTKDDQHAFFRNYLIPKWTTCDMEAHSLTTLLVSHFWGTVDTDLRTHLGNTPLHCYMIAELLEEILDYPYGFENGPRVKKIYTKTEIFEVLFQKKTNVFIEEKEKTLSSNKSIIKFVKNGIFQLHAFLALKLLFPDKMHMYSEPDSLHDFEELDVLKIGIVTSMEPIIFIHRTFAEFMVARFIFQIFETGRLNLGCSVEIFYDLVLKVLDFDQSISMPLYPVVCIFLNEFFDTCDTNKLQWFTCNCICKSELPNSRKVADYLEMTIRNNLFNLSWLILKLLNTIDDFYEHVLIAVIKASRKLPQPKCFIKLCDCFGLTQNGMDIDNPRHYKILEVALQQGNYSISKYMIHKWFPPHVWHRISYMRNNGGGILHILVDYDLFFNFFCFKERLELISYIHERDQTAIEVRDNFGRTPLLTLPLLLNKKYYGHFYIKKILIEMMHADVNATTSDGGNGLYLIKDSYSLPYTFDLEDAGNYHEILKLFLDHGFNLINSKCPNGCSLLTNAVHTFGSNLQERTIQLFKNADANFNEIDNDGQTILHYCVEFVEDVKFTELLISYGCNMTVKNRNDQCALCMAVTLGKTNMTKMMSKLFGNLDNVGICDKDCNAAVKTVSVIREMECEFKSSDNTPKVSYYPTFYKPFILYLERPCYMSRKKKQLCKEYLRKLNEQSFSGTQFSIKKARDLGLIYGRPQMIT